MENENGEWGMENGEWRMGNVGMENGEFHTPVKMVDSCSRENAILSTVARSWLLFLHDESEWKMFELNIA